MTASHKSIVPPTQELKFTPKITGSLPRLILLTGLSIFVIITAIMLSLYLLLLFVLIIPGFVLVFMYQKNGFMNVTKQGVDLAGFSGRINKHIAFSDIYKVAKAKTLHIPGRNGGANSPAVIFLNAQGDQAFFAMGYHYSNEDLQRLFNLFDSKDRMEFDFVTLNDIKDAFNKTLG